MLNIEHLRVIKTFKHKHKLYLNDVKIKVLQYQKKEAYKIIPLLNISFKHH